MAAVEAPCGLVKPLRRACGTCQVEKLYAVLRSLGLPESTPELHCQMDSSLCTGGVVLTGRYVLCTNLVTVTDPLGE